MARTGRKSSRRELRQARGPDGSGVFERPQLKNDITLSVPILEEVLEQGEDNSLYITSNEATPLDRLNSFYVLAATYLANGEYSKPRTGAKSLGVRKVYKTEFKETSELVKTLAEQEKVPDYNGHAKVTININNFENDFYFSHELTRANIDDAVTLKREYLKDAYEAGNRDLDTTVKLLGMEGRKTEVNKLLMKFEVYQRVGK